MKASIAMQNPNQLLKNSFLWLKYLEVVFLAIVVTAALFYAMYLLIRMDEPLLIDEPRERIPDVIANFPKEIKTLEPDEKPQKPQLVEQPPKPEIKEPVITNIEKGIGIDPVITELPGNVIPGIIGNFDQPMPIVRINPQYPVNASARGIEGYVDVVFDITPMGTTSNIRIVGYFPSSVFNNSVKKAVQGWKYRPMADENGGKSILDVKERITFVMEK